MGGYYQALSGQDNCDTPCPAGTYSSGSAATCSICSAGRYSSIEAASSCIICPLGKFNSDEAKDASKHNSSTSCIKCPDGSLSTVTRFSCESCSGGHFVQNNSLCVD